MCIMGSHYNYQDFYSIWGKCVLLVAVCVGCFKRETHHAIKNPVAATTLCQSRSPQTVAHYLVILSSDKSEISQIWKNLDLIHEIQSSLVQNTNLSVLRLYFAKVRHELGQIFSHLLKILAKPLNHCSHFLFVQQNMY